MCRIAISAEEDAEEDFCSNLEILDVFFRVGETRQPVKARVGNMSGAWMEAIFFNFKPEHEDAFSALIAEGRFTRLIFHLMMRFTL